MYGLVESIHALIDGQTAAIVSVIGKRYTKAELQPRKLGGRAAIFNDVGMTKEETKGAWEVETDLSLHFQRFGRK